MMYYFGDLVDVLGGWGFTELVIDNIANIQIRILIN